MSGPTYVRLRILVESVTADGDETEYRFESTSNGPSKFSLQGEAPILFTGGVLSIQTVESLEDQTCSLTFQSTPVVQKFLSHVRTNDHVRVEAALVGSRMRLIHDGFVSPVRQSRMGSTNSIEMGAVIESRGLKKLLQQSVYNWQGTMAVGQDVKLAAEAFAAYHELMKNGVKNPPHIVMQQFINIALGTALKLKIRATDSSDGSEGGSTDGSIAIKAGEFFDFGPPFTSYYTPSGIFPNSANIIYQGWQGPLWGILQQLVEPDLHELFLRYGGEIGKEKTIIVHRPIPFPDGLKNEDWETIAASPWVSGKLDDPDIQFRGGASAITSQLSDHRRVNAFHWSPPSFMDASTTVGWAKLTFGWYLNEPGAARYGFAPREVTSRLIPVEGDYIEMILAILYRVAVQDSPLHLLETWTLQFPRPLFGMRPGEVLEDWSTGKPCTGYIQSVTHNLNFAPNGLSASTHVTMDRVKVGARADNYAAQVTALVQPTLKHYQMSAGQKSALQQAQDGHIGQPVTPFKPLGAPDASGIPLALLINRYALSNDVSPAALAAILQHESGIGRNPAAYKKNPSSTALGIGQFLKSTADGSDLAGCMNPDGSGRFTSADRLNDEKSINATAYYMNKIGGRLQAAGLSPTSPDYYTWVAYAYNQGAAAAATQGVAMGWTMGPGLSIAGNNNPLYWLTMNGTIAGLSGVGK